MGMWRASYAKIREFFFLNPIQEDTTGNDQVRGYKESLGRLDQSQSQHFLLVFTQVTNGQPFVRIDTSKAAPSFVQARARNFVTSCSRSHCRGTA
eukprot:scaffold470_cov135-Isochrysis_galbana.AAC.4